ncbi:MAG TPA: nuclear transport factor 2 family protein, partial [Kofleriaceae bacterium]
MRYRADDERATGGYDSEMTPAETLIALEKDTLAAYKRQDPASFTKAFGRDYIGVANDGVLTGDDEVAKMKQLELDELHLEEPKVVFPKDGVAVITYKMITRGKAAGKPMSATIWTSSVYVQRGERWEAVLHTES